MRNVNKIPIGKNTGVILGDGNIYIQSMLSVRADDILGNVAQAIELEQAGCEILRFAIPTKKDIVLIPAIKENVKIPLVADIHFDYRIALEAISAGIDKIRINPGNIGTEDRIKKVADACRINNIPIRIGVNSGSLEKHILAKYGKVTAEALAESAFYHARLLEKFDFNDIIISIKSSNVPMMIEAYRIFAEKSEYPLHLGVTEAGTKRMGMVKSAIGIGSLLCDEIGETIRVSLTADPVEEISAAKDILKAIGKGGGVEIISCPTCGRTQIALISLAEQVEERSKSINKDIKIAVMGCIVNGPGEAREADIGIAGGKGQGLIFKKGEVIKKVPENQLLDELFKEIEQM